MSSVSDNNIVKVPIRDNNDYENEYQPNSLLLSIVPDEIFIEIFQAIVQKVEKKEIKDFCSITATCRKFHRIFYSRNILHRILEKYFPYSISKSTNLKKLIQSSLRAFRFDSNVRASGCYHIQTLTGHQDWVCCLSLQGDLLFTGSSDSTVKVWKMRENGNFTELQTLTGHQSSVHCLSLQGDLLFTGSSDNTVKIWKMGEDGMFTELQTLTGHQDWVSCLALQGG